MGNGKGSRMDEWAKLKEDLLLSISLRDNLCDYNFNLFLFLGQKKVETMEGGKV